jgi:TetR/AcrR family transcriptional regulator, regulator of cefoperazone and chloramphenicol sensitivity
VRTVQHTRSSRDDTRRKILQAAGRIFAERGFDAATIKQITDAAKVNVAAVNYHFGSKRKLYLEVLRVALPDIRERPFHTIPGASPKDELRTFISSVFSSMLGADRPRWHSEVAIREVVSPTGALPKLVEEYFVPFTRDLENLVRKFCAHEPEVELVRLVAQSIMALCVYWVIFRRFLPYVWPGFSLSEARSKWIADYVYELSLQAMMALEKSAQARVSRR